MNTKKKTQGKKRKVSVIGRNEFPERRTTLKTTNNTRMMSHPVTNDVKECSHLQRRKGMKFLLMIVETDTEIVQVEEDASSCVEEEEMLEVVELEAVTLPEGAEVALGTTEAMIEVHPDLQVVVTTVVHTARVVIASAKTTTMLKEKSWKLLGGVEQRMRTAIIRNKVILAQVIRQVKLTRGTVTNPVIGIKTVVNDLDPGTIEVETVEEEEWVNNWMIRGLMIVVIDSLMMMVRRESHLDEMIDGMIVVMIDEMTGEMIDVVTIVDMTTG